MVHHQLAGLVLMGGGGNDERTHQAPLPDELAAETGSSVSGAAGKRGQRSTIRPVFSASPEFIKGRHSSRVSVCRNDRI